MGTARRYDVTFVKFNAREIFAIIRDFDVLLDVHLGIILVINQLNAQILVL